MTEPGKIKAKDIKPGMPVEATKGDLGEADVSKPRVSEVVKDKAGKVEKLKVKKGILFQKEVEIPAERIQAIEPTPEADQEHKIVVAATEAEIEALSAVRSEELKAEKEDRDVVEQIQHNLPTVEGMQERETSRANTNPQKSGLLQVLGPGFLSGMAGNDSSAVTTYSVDGAKNGYGHLWLLLLSTPLLQAVQYTCAKVGRLSQKGFSELLVEHYGRKIAIPASLILILANLGLIAADLVAVGSGLQLLTGLNWAWFVVPVAALLWYITVYQNFEVIKKIFVIMSLAFVAYLVTAVLSGADWGSVISNTFIPHFDFGFDSISSAVALLGATISPYTMFWQVQGEKEEERPGSTKEQLRLAAVDIGSGVLSGNLVAYSIMVCTSATLFTNHKDIQTAADAARSLQPLLGPFAEILFAIGLIGAGLIAIPVLLASTSYAVAGTFGWPSSLSKKPWQNEGFYLILTVALLASLGIALFGFDPVQLMFWANVLQGMLAPFLVVLLILVSNNRKIVGEHQTSLLLNIGLGLAALIMFISTGLLFYGLFTGQGG